MPICMQINFIIQFFLTILQRKSKLVILVDLGMPGYTHLKWYLTFICRQKIKLILHVFLEILQKYCKLIVLGTLGMPGYQTQSDNINLKKAFMFICRQKINFTQILFWRYCKDMQTSCFEDFGYAWLHTPKVIVSTCRTRQSLSACQKINFIIPSFLRYYILKNPAT